jgi:uncharacterized protein with ParB-like and HNH nuclease domain
MPSMPEGAITSRDLSIGKLFEDFYIVPKYQREFVWREHEVRKLLDDIYAEYCSDEDAHQVEYFVGSMVVCPSDNGAYEVIDGQQRLTTFWIFFCALKQFFRLQKHNVPSDLGSKIIGPIKNSEVDSSRFRVGLHYMEGQGIQRVFADPDQLKGLKIAKKSRSIDNLNSAHYVIFEFLNDMFDGRSDEARAFYRYVCHKVKIIRVQTATVSRALKIFETINDRGIGLDSMDLLKNLLFMKAKQSDYDQLRSSWQSFVDLLYNHKKEKPLRFIRYYIYANFKVDRLQEDDVYDWFERNKSRCGIESEPLTFVEELKASAYAYTQFLDGLNLDDTQNRFLTNIGLLGGSSRQHLMLLLAARHLDQSNFVHFCEWTENLLCIYSIARELGRAIEPKFARWTPEIRNMDASSKDDLDKFLRRRYLQEIANFRQRFTLAFEEMTDQNIQKYKLKYILGKIYQYIEYKAFEKSSDLDLTRFTDTRTEIEHVFPINPKEGFKVQIAGTADEYDNVVHQLGNLALVESSINAAIANKPLEAKRLGFAKSGLILTRHLAEAVALGNTKIDQAFKDVPFFKEWTLKTISDRQGMFRDLAVKTWGLEQMPDFSSVLES